MASLRAGTRKDGSTYVQVLYRVDGKQSSTSFEDMASAVKFQMLARKFGPAKAATLPPAPSCRDSRPDVTTMTTLSETTKRTHRRVRYNQTTQ